MSAQKKLTHDKNDCLHLSFTLNGQRIREEISTDMSMAEFLQEHMGLSGTKVCCEIGICKACTFIYQDKEGGELKRLQACTTPAAAMQGLLVTTVEGLAKDGKLTALQEAFLKNFSFQCGYSTPGFLMGATVLLDQLKRNPISKEQIQEEINKAVGSHICRCTGYVRYHAAIREVILNSPELLKG